MKKIILIGSILGLFLHSCDIRKSNQKTKTENKQKVSYQSTVEIIDSVYDFGTIEEGKIVDYAFKFKNTGKNPLVVYEAVASCGCTVPEKPEQPIKPGEIGTIKVKFNSTNRPGEAHKTITVTSNAQPDFPVLMIKGTVKGKES